MEQNKVSKAARIAALPQVGFAGLVVFCLVGNCTGHREVSVNALVIIAVMWVLLRIMLEGIFASVLLVGPGSGKQPPKRGDDKSPPYPPTASA